MWTSVRRAVFLGGILLFSTSEGFAHHFFPRESDTPVSIVGTVVAFKMINPHSLLLLHVTDADGAARMWTIELGSVLALKGRGWDRDSLKPGHTVRVETILARGRPYVGSAREIELPDGRRLFAGSHAGDYPRR